MTEEINDDELKKKLEEEDLKPDVKKFGWGESGQVVLTKKGIDNSKKTPNQIIDDLL